MRRSETLNTMSARMYDILWERLGQAGRLAQNYKRTGVIGDLEEAIRVMEQAIDMTPTGYTNLAPMLNDLGVLLSMRSERTGAIDDLNRAIEIGDKAVTATPLDDPNRAGRLSNLGIRLAQRFERTGAIDDLNRAIEASDEAVTAIPLDHPVRAALLNNLGAMLSRRFERTGVIDDLNRAVEVSDEGVTAAPLDHPDRAAWLSNLGNHLGMRFERTGVIDDLNRAVEVCDKAVIALPLNHPDRAGRLTNLGNQLGTRFERTGAIDDLNRAVEVCDKAVVATPLDHPDRASRLNNLGNQLGRRFERTGAIDDLNRAVKVSAEAMTVIPPDHSGLAAFLSNLGSLLGMRFEWTGAIDDLNRAIEVSDEAVTAAPPDHHGRAVFLSNLGNRLGRRFERTGAEKDIKRSLLSFKEGWNCQNARPFTRIDLARKAATILASQLNWEESSKFLQDAIKLLPAVSPRSLENTDKQHMLGEFAGLASMAAAITLKAGKEPHHALELLELGRGVIAGLLLEMRTDISDLKQKHREIAEEFESLRDELDSPTSRTALSLVSSVNRRSEAGQKFDEIIARIRAQPGFQNFFLPPTADELMAAAAPGPIVVVNITSYRCDAFLIERNQIRVLELPDLRQQEVEERVQNLNSNRLSLTSTLEWLWHAAARPILDILGFEQPPIDNNWPHVWWILTGALSHLPIHAAGQVEGSTETVLDRVMSSYSSSVKALIYGRQHSVTKLGPESEHALLVAMRETPGLFENSALPFAVDEVAMVNDVCSSLQLKPVRPPPRKEDVLAHLRTCKIFHFAGHGQSDPLEPSRSCLLLEDWEDNPLTVADLRDYRLQKNSPFLGYLSACSTSTNKADKLIDEGIHLVSACQLAGFRHVIGTLWEVSDKYCVDVAKVLYETLRDEGMTDVALCRGLHRAIRALRDGDDEMERITGESSTATKTDIHYNGMETAKVDDSSIETICEDGGRSGAVNENSLQDRKVEDDGPAMAIQVDGRSACEGRDAILVGDTSHRQEQGKPLHWVPYIHFGI